jgi:hypothetical protein
LQQLQREAQSKAAVRQQGHGSVSDVPESRLLREAEAAGGPLVCHLALEGSPLDDDLDEHLAALAHQHLGTRFVRAVINLRTSTLHLKLRTPAGPGRCLAWPQHLLLGWPPLLLLLMLNDGPAPAPAPPLK